MLRPFLATIHDSFRAALASKALYILAGLLIALLVALAPFHVSTDVEWELSWNRHFPDRARLATRLVEDGPDGKRPAVAAVWNRLSGGLQQKLIDFVGDNRVPAEDENGESGKTSEESARESGDNRRGGGMPDEWLFENLADELNALMPERDFFEKEQFARLRLTAEASALLERERDSLADSDVRRLNRLLLATALRGDIEMPSASQIDLYYGPWRLPGLFAGLSHAEMARLVSGWLLYYFDKVVMSIGIFIAILVTASIVPDMLEPGSLNLLLSKPVPRWVLLLAKFFGGCAFILLIAGIFFTGVWLWLGIQGGIWEKGLLYSIPVYAFVFAIYYSISVLVAIRFRSPVLSIALAILFWAACFAVGFGYNRLDAWVYNRTPVEMAACGDQAFYADIFGNHYRWDPAASAWARLGESSFPDDIRMLETSQSLVFRLDHEFPSTGRPITDANGTVYAYHAPLLNTALSGSGGDIIAIPRDQQDKLFALPAPPPSMKSLLGVRDGKMLVIDSSADIWEHSASDLREFSGSAETTGSGPARRPGPGSLTGRILKGASPFVKVSEHDGAFSFFGPRSASMNESGQVALYHGKEICLLERGGDDSRYRVVRETSLGAHDNRRMTSFVEFRGQTIFVALGNGQFFHLDAATLETVWSGAINTRSAIRTMAASPDGRYAAVAFRDGSIWLYDATKKGPADFAPSGSGHILSVAFDEQGRLWTADRFLAARAWNLATGSEEFQLVGTTDGFTNLYRYFVRPFYRVFPKPGEFHRLVTALSSSGDVSRNPDIDLRTEPQADDPWHPLTNGVFFIAATLGLACWMFQRKEF